VSREVAAEEVHAPRHPIEQVSKQTGKAEEKEQEKPLGKTQSSSVSGVSRSPEFGVVLHDTH
jgi:hypothetical protein